MTWLTTKYFIVGSVVYVTPLWGIALALTLVWGFFMSRWVNKKLEQLPRVQLPPRSQP